MRSAVTVGGEASPLLPPSEGSSLFVLDEQAVFLSESRQELHLFNTAATFVWCQLEQGRGPREIAAIYARAFGVRSNDARRVVDDAIRGWQKLGYLSSRGPRTRTRLAPLAALRTLLRRARFGVHTTSSTRLRHNGGSPKREVSTDGQSPFAATERVTASALAAGWDPTAIFAEMRDRDCEATARTRRYRLHATTFRVRYASAQGESQVHPPLAHLEELAAQAFQTTLDILEGDAGYLVLADGAPVGFVPQLHQLAPLVKATVRALAANRHRYLMQIHAAVVATRGHCLLMPGASGSGKTTLSAALSRSGFQYCSDEVALLEEETLDVAPFPLSLTVKPGATSLLEPLYPTVRELARHQREDGKTVCYLNPPADFCTTTGSLPVGWIVFPRYVPDTKTELRPLGKPDAIQRLLAECIVLPNALARSRVERLVRWIRRVDCYDLPVGSLADAVSVLRGLCNVIGPPDLRWRDEDDALQHRVGLHTGGRVGAPCQAAISGLPTLSGAEGHAASLPA